MAKVGEYPDEGEHVVCTVKNVKGFGAFVLLDEYENKEGFIHITEIATGWVKYIRDHIREGQRIVCKVMRVDQEKGHIDLSLKTITEHHKREKIQHWKNEQKARKLMEIVAERLKIQPDDLFEEFGNSLIEKYGSLYGALEIALDKARLKKDGFKGPWIAAFNKVAEENIVPPSVKISGTLHLRSNNPDGINSIKKALLAAEKEGGENVDVQYMGAPNYRVVIIAEDYKVAEDILKRVTEIGVSTIAGDGGEGSFSRGDE